MMDVDVLHATVVRTNTKVPWGLQIQGGNGEPLIISQISAGSPAGKIGIRIGDQITQVQGKNVTKMTSRDVIALVNQQGCTLMLTVERPVASIALHDASHVPAVKSVSNNTQSQTSVYKPRPPLWYTPPVKTQTREILSSVSVHNQRNERQTDDDIPVTSSECLDALNSVQLSETPIYGSEEVPYQFEYKTVHAQPFTRSGRLTPRQRQNTVESRSSSEAEGPITSSPHSFSPPCYSPIPNYQSSLNDAPNQSYYQTALNDAPNQHYDSTIDAYDDKLTQSRTFRILQSLMFNEAPPLGDQALPPLRSASLEQRREEEQQKRTTPTRQRIRVFMPQQYNSPLSMYSAPNIINTFQDQAEKYFESLERKNRQEQANMYVEDRSIYEY